MTASANWRNEAACRDADTDLFFPVGPAGPALRQVDEAKRICRTCLVQAPVPGLGTGPRGHRWRMGREHGRRAARHPAPNQED